MKTNQFRAMVLALLMAVISLATVSAQAITVSGTVTDAKDGTPLVGCSVQIKGTTKGTVTNMNGQYTIQSKKGETLLFQYIGYKQEKRVVKSSTLDVKMKADELVLEECVVVGYGHELSTTKSMSTAYMAVCPASGIMYNAVNAEEYGEIQENGFKNVSDAPLSTFSIDVDLLLTAICVVLSIKVNCLQSMQSVRKN